MGTPTRPLHHCRFVATPVGGEPRPEAVLLLGMVEERLAAAPRHGVSVLIVDRMPSGGECQYCSAQPHTHTVALCACAAVVVVLLLLG